jgi:hypothetical protein
MKNINVPDLTKIAGKNRYYLVGLLFILMLMPLNTVSAQDHGFGLGVILGEPSGLSAKYWTSRDNAFDFGLGFSVGGDRITYHGNYYGSSRIHFHADYLWHSFNAIRSTERFPLYYGIGARFNSGGGYDGSFGVRGVFGIAWFPHSTPIDIFAELVPVFQLTPTAGLGFDAGVGIRYFFN